MHLPNRMLAGAALLVAAACAQAAPCSNLEPARWLLGQWEAVSGDKRVLETWREVSATTFDGRLEVTVNDGAERGFKLQFRRPDRT